ncbi:DUF1802 family protein [Paenibacillus sp. TRM 82003]|uniref:DUF1802 family protein n=1 Tax=Kineococcus sp. TRM81007 TaxID=2925831 RepID=UPI001F5931B3|nr:DUF1802 family protein [Kineococcus sp. TRM81007]MCI2237131.1 DUF1802 family protein [Kineococcus sp. TRM81007]MCI3925252.1 DUF1802 family protein [Paenibacillus sp. TRM 82003]
MSDPVTPEPAASTPALKEWGAVVHALLQGRQSLLLRKGGIHEKRFTVGASRFVLFPTVAHSHAESVRPEHRDLLPPGAADAAEVDGEELVVRAGAEVVAVVPVALPERVEELEDLHVWTSGSVRSSRVDFRPRHQLTALVVRAVELPEPVRLVRRPEHRGCTSWVDLDVPWPAGTGRVVHDDEHLAAVEAAVRSRVG